MTRNQIIQRLETARLNRVSPDFSRMDLTGLDLSELDFRNTNFSFSQLAETDLRGANLVPGYFAGSSLRDADLRDTQFQWRDLKWANVAGTGIVPIVAGWYHNCLSLTHLHVGCVRVPLDDIPDDDDQAAWERIHKYAWRWWQRHGELVRRTIADTEDERQVVIARLHTKHCGFGPSED